MYLTLNRIVDLSFWDKDRLGHRLRTAEIGFDLRSWTIRHCYPWNEVYREDAIKVEEKLGLAAVNQLRSFLYMKGG